MFEEGALHTNWDQDYLLPGEFMTNDLGSARFFEHVIFGTSCPFGWFERRRMHVAIRKPVKNPVGTIMAPVEFRKRGVAVRATRVGFTC